MLGIALLAWRVAGCTCFFACSVDFFDSSDLSIFLSVYPGNVKARREDFSCMGFCKLGLRRLWSCFSTLPPAID